LESTVNYLKPTCTEKDLKISTMACEINCKVEDIRTLDQQIKVLINDLEDFRNKNRAVQRQNGRTPETDRQISQRPHLRRELRLTEG
jgi:hypothetical protein